MPSDASPPEKIENPWLRAFLAEPWEKIALAQVSIRRVDAGFELHHIDDSSPKKQIRLADLRDLANFTASGEFRPLKSSPDLPLGWILRLHSTQELELALQTIYPNALADLHAIKTKSARPTDYRAFTARQSGMYRITTFLDDEGVARLIDRVCNRICLKRRLWSIGPRPSDPPAAELLIPCLEPCAILLEAARKEVRALQASGLLNSEDPE
jgi:hypothetical protein